MAIITTADRLLWLEERLRYNDWLNRPEDEREHDETLRRHDFYSAMAYWLASAAADAEAAVDGAATNNDREFNAFAESALWRWTQYLRYAHRFHVDFSGEWALAYETGDRPADAEETAYEAQALPPIDPRDRSFLRVELLSALLQELDPFIAVLEHQERGQRIIGRWKDWLRSCTCRPSEVSPRCGVHRFVAEVNRFHEIMNREVSQDHTADRVARFQTLPDIYEP
jgi:hypothetical protein